MALDSIQSQLFEAATLMLVGMVVVFAFLAMLIVGIKLIARFCERFPGQEPQQPVRARAPQTVTSSQGLDKKVVAAITAAVKTHRQAK